MPGLSELARQLRRYRIKELKEPGLAAHGTAPMKSGTWQFKAVLIGAGAAACVAAGLAWPKVSFWLAKRQAVQSIGSIAAADQTVMRCVLAAEVKVIPPATPAGKVIHWTGDGYRIALPAEEFRRPDDGNSGDLAKVFVGRKVTVRVQGVGPKTASFAAGMAPTSQEVARFFRETDPYEIVVSAFNATPADVLDATDSASLQKGLYLLLMKSVLQTIGSQKLWQRIECGGCKGILSGDTSCIAVVVDLYCPRTKEFATLTIKPGEGASMDDVYRCIGQIRIERDPAATRPATGINPSVLPRMNS
jgi:hypothetical protein